MLLFLNLLVNPMFPVQNCYQALAYGLFLILIIPTVADKTQWGLIVGSDKLVNIPTNITIKQLLYCNACDGISSFENDGIGYFLGVADVTPTNIIFRFKENPQTFRWFILSK